MTPSDTSNPSDPLVVESAHPGVPSGSQQPIESAQPVNPSARDNPSYVKLAMRNMVKKGGKSLFHFSLSALGLLTLLVGLAYLTR